MPATPEDPLVSYRETLEVRYSELSSAYDKAIMTLSGGALAVSLTFIKEIAPSPLASTIWLLVLSWCAFALSIAAILVGLLLGQYAIRKAISQVNANTIHSETPGGWFAPVTEILGCSAALLFLSGVVSLSIFSATNLRSANHVNQRERAAVAEAPATH